MGYLVATIVHEVKQPIAAIVINAQTALRWLDRPAPDLDEARQALSRIVSDGAARTPSSDGFPINAIEAMNGASESLTQKV